MLHNKLILLKTNVGHDKALGLEHYLWLKMLVLASLPILVMTAKKILQAQPMQVPGWTCFLQPALQARLVTQSIPVCKKRE